MTGKEERGTDIYILDRELNVTGVVGTYDSIIWMNRLYEPGPFKAEFAYSQEMDRKLERGTMLYRTDEAEPAVITRKYLKLNREGRQTIQVQGRMASWILARRIIWERMEMQGTPEEIIRCMVYRQAIEPKDGRRKLGGIVLGDMAGGGEVIRKQVTYGNLQEEATAVAKAHGLGYRLRLDMAERMMFFECYRGKDRTAGTEHPCIFSRDFNNVFTQDYYEDEANYRNVCLVGGTGEGDGRRLVVVGDAEGYNRHEMFWNASGLSDSGENTSEEEYLGQLRQKGLEKLENYQLVISFENKVNQERAMEYGLGDYVTCTDGQWGVTINAQVTAIERGYSRSEESCYITLGNRVPTLLDMIKAKE